MISVEAWRGRDAAAGILDPSRDRQRLRDRLRKLFMAQVAPHAFVNEAFIYDLWGYSACKCY